MDSDPLRTFEEMSPCVQNRSREGQTVPPPPFTHFALSTKRAGRVIGSNPGGQRDWRSHHRLDWLDMGGAAWSAAGHQHEANTLLLRNSFENLSAFAGLTTDSLNERFAACDLAL